MIHSSEQSGGTTASVDGFRICKIGVPKYYLAILFPENRMNMKEFGQRGAARSWRPLDPLLGISPHLVSGSATEPWIWIFNVDLANHKHQWKFQPSPDIETTVSFSDYNRVFHKLSTIQKCQYCQLCFSCVIRNEQNQWRLQPWNIIYLYSLISYLTFTNIIGCK